MGKEVSMGAENCILTESMQNTSPFSTIAMKSGSTGKAAKYTDIAIGLEGIGRCKEEKHAGARTKCNFVG